MCCSVHCSESCCIARMVVEWAILQMPLRKYKCGCVHIYNLNICSITHIYIYIYMTYTYIWHTRMCARAHARVRVCVCACVFARVSDLPEARPLVCIESIPQDPMFLWAVPFFFKLRCNVKHINKVKTHAWLVNKASVLPRTATHCQTLQHDATHCSTLQHLAYSISCLVSMGRAHLFCGALFQKGAHCVGIFGSRDIHRDIHNETTTPSYGPAHFFCGALFQKGAQCAGLFWNRALHNTKESYTMRWTYPSMEKRTCSVELFSKGYSLCGALLKKSPIQHDQYTLLWNSALVLWCSSAKKRQPPMAPWQQLLWKSPVGLF